MATPFRVRGVDRNPRTNTKGRNGGGNPRTRARVRGVVAEWHARETRFGSSDGIGHHKARLQNTGQLARNPEIEK